MDTQITASKEEAAAEADAYQKRARRADIFDDITDCIAPEVSDWLNSEGDDAGCHSPEVNCTVDAMRLVFSPFVFLLTGLSK